MKYAFIATQVGRYPVRLMCRVLQVSRSGYYAARQRAPSRRAQTDALLQARIGAIFTSSRQRYGAPRIQAELRVHGYPCSRKRVARLMRAAHLQAYRPRRRRPQTTQVVAGQPPAPNLLARRFAVADVAGRDRVWAADITYLPTRAGWLYLAVVLDLASRRVIGWSMQPTLASELAADALQMALGARHPAPGLLHHSDRGVQYASQLYRTLLAGQTARVSMSRRANCWDNAVVESFFATLECELIARADWHTHQEARQAVFEFMEVWYNRQRRHSSLGYLTPAEFEAQLVPSARQPEQA